MCCVYKTQVHTVGMCYVCEYMRHQSVHYVKQEVQSIRLVIYIACQSHEAHHLGTKNLQSSLD